MHKHTPIRPHIHARRQTRGWHVRKKGGAPTPAASLFRSSLSLSPFFPRSGNLTLCSLAYSLSYDPSLSNSTLPFTPRASSLSIFPPASTFTAALSSSALLSCEKGWLLERKRGPSPERGAESSERRTPRGLEGDGATTNGGGQDERWVQRTEPSQLQDN